MIVDSCIQRLDDGNKQSAAVTYLREIGVDLAHQVSRVVATHWHDDHIGGLSQVVKECTSANFCCATALRQDEFIGFASVYAEADPSPLARSTREIIAILDMLEGRGKAPDFLKQDTLLRRTDSNVSIWALSPSNERIRDFLARVAASMPTLKAARSGGIDPPCTRLLITVRTPQSVPRFGIRCCRLIRSLYSHQIPASLGSCRAHRQLSV